jgi:hypothetical protein
VPQKVVSPASHLVDHADKLFRLESSTRPTTELLTLCLYSQDSKIWRKSEGPKCVFMFSKCCVDYLICYRRHLIAHTFSVANLLGLMLQYSTTECELIIVFQFSHNVTISRNFGYFHYLNWDTRLKPRTSLFSSKFNDVDSGVWFLHILPLVLKIEHKLSILTLFVNKLKETNCLRVRTLCWEHVDGKKGSSSRLRKNA